MVLIAEYNTGGTLQRRYVHGPAIDEPIVWYESAGTSDRRWLVADQLGTITAVTDGSGAVTTIYSYDEYGRPNAWSGARFRFTGQMMLPEAQLYHYRARAYDPVLGRFLQTDPILYDGGMNLYAYVANDPLNLVDPLGLQSKDDIIVTARPPPRIYLDFGPSFGSTYVSDVETVAQVDQNTIVVTGCGPSCRNRYANRVLFGALWHTFDRSLQIAPITGGWYAFGRCIAGGGCSPWDFLPGRAGAMARMGRRCCFVAGTLVWTAVGLRPIEEVEVGDLVWSRNSETGETSLQPVTAIIDNHERMLWHVRLMVADREVLFGTTDDHPWRSAEGDWVRTDELHEGMLVLRADGEPARVVGAQNTGTTVVTFNLTVAVFHTYFVGVDRIWVHNCPEDEVGGRRPMREGVRPNHVQNAQARQARQQAERPVGRRMTDDEQNEFYERITVQEMNYHQLLAEAAAILRGE